MIVIGLMWGGVIRGPSHGPGIKGDPGTKGDPGANGKDGRSYMYLYTGSTTLIQDGPREPGYINWDNINQSSAGEVDISHITSDGINIDSFFEQTIKDKVLYIQDLNNIANFIRYDIRVANNKGAYTQLGVDYIDSGGTGATSFGNDKNMFFLIFSKPGRN